MRLPASSICNASALTELFLVRLHRHPQRGLRSADQTLHPLVRQSSARRFTKKSQRRLGIRTRAWRDSDTLSAAAGRCSARARRPTLRTPASTAPALPPYGRGTHPRVPARGRRSSTSARKLHQRRRRRLPFGRLAHRVQLRDQKGALAVVHARHAVKQLPAVMRSLGRHHEHARPCLQQLVAQHVAIRSRRAPSRPARCPPPRPSATPPRPAETRASPSGARTGTSFSTSPATVASASIIFAFATSTATMHPATSVPSRSATRTAWTPTALYVCFFFIGDDLLHAGVFRPPPEASPTLLPLTPFHATEPRPRHGASPSAPRTSLPRHGTSLPRHGTSTPTFFCRVTHIARWRLYMEEAGRKLGERQGTPGRAFAAHRQGFLRGPFGFS